MNPHYHSCVFMTDIYLTTSRKGESTSQQKKCYMDIGPSKAWFPIDSLLKVTQNVYNGGDLWWHSG